MGFVFCDSYYSMGALCTRFTLVDKNSPRSSRTSIDAKLLLGVVGRYCCCACELNLVVSIGNSQMSKKFGFAEDK
jgi:hypothetical protein